ncbi:MAG: hypothetical protein QM500_20220 [Methylococcales bacterium]
MAFKSISFVAIILFFLTSANSAPIQLSETDFYSQISGLATVIEDFEGYRIGPKTSPFRFVNGTYNGSGNPAVENAEVFCNDGDQCLTNQSIGGRKVFNNFSTRTVYWAVSMDFVRPSDPFNIRVNTGSGVLSVDFTANQQSYFLGFYDALGIDSVSIKNYGANNQMGNYSFDNITTNAVPIPTALWLFGSGLLELLRVARRKKV